MLAGRAAAQESEAPATYDLLLRGGRIVDGTGNPWFAGDVAVRGERIAAVGRIPEGDAGRVIDCGGLAVAPGFIDIHSHSDMLLLEDGRAESKVRQGVTTEVLGEGSSAGPSKGRLPPRRFEAQGRTFEWETLGGYFRALEEAGIAVNVASYVGHGTLRRCVLGDARRNPTEEEFQRMEELLAEALEEGAFGLSSMLGGPPGIWASTEELIRLARVTARYGGIYSTHIRNEGEGVFEAVEEAIRIAREARIRTDIIHLKIADQRLWGRMVEVARKIDEARREGIDVHANVYPYTRGNNSLAGMIPPWAFEGGFEAMLKRLADPETRERIKRDIRRGLPGWYDHYLAVGGDWSRMLVNAALSERNKRFEGWTLDRIIEAKRAELGHRADGFDVVFALLQEERNSVSTIYAHHSEADMREALRQPWCSVGSDGLAYAQEGPLRRGKPHPRSFGTFPRVLGVYARETRLLTLEDAVRKMTSLNAAKLGILDRGILRTGFFADIVVFNPKTVRDRATYLDPFHYPEGIEYVIVNGKIVLEKGRRTDALPGRVLRRGR